MLKQARARSISGVSAKHSLPGQHCCKCLVLGEGEHNDRPDEPSVLTALPCSRYCPKPARSPSNERRYRRDCPKLFQQPARENPLDTCRVSFHVGPYFSQVGASGKPGAVHSSDDGQLRRVVMVPDPSGHALQSACDRSAARNRLKPLISGPPPGLRPTGAHPERTKAHSV